MITVRKLKLVIINNDEQIKKEQYKYIRNEQYEQYKALNLGMTLLSTNNILNSYNTGEEKKVESQIKKLEGKIIKLNKDLDKAKKEDRIAKIKINIDELNKEIIKLRDNLKKSESLRSDIDVKFKEMYIDDFYTVLQSKVDLKNKDNMSLITRRVKDDYSAALKNGLSRGERSLTNYKRTFPLLVRNRDLRFYEEDGEFYIKWVKGIIFKIILGRKDKNKDELIATLQRVIRYIDIPNKIESNELDDKGIPKKIDNPEKDYRICDSSISFIDNELILNLTLGMKQAQTKIDFIPGRVVGVDVGVKIPAYCALNDVHYIKRSIGSYESFMKVNAQFRARRRSLQIALKATEGGKGRNNKLKALNDFIEKQSNYNRNYNHFLSKEIVKFALDNRAGQINLELLSMQEATKGTILNDWSYYQLKEMIVTKAKKYGIVVKTVDPYHTSQICSKCGNFEEGQREQQDRFICKKCNFEVNADYNAARNIAMSKVYIDKKEQSEYNKNIKNKN